MKILFICEYVTGGGYIKKKIPKKLFQQATLILKSLLNDFNKIPNTKIIYTWDSRFKKFKDYKNTKCFFIKKNSVNKWKELIKKSDFFFPIAPETEKSLIKLIKLNNSKKVISNKISAIKKTTSKYETYKFFKKNSIPTLKTFCSKNKINYDIYEKWVVKPDDGAGCEKNYIFDDKKKLSNFLNNNKNFIAQPLVKGSSYSANVILINKKTKILNFNKQIIFYKKNKIIFNGTRFIKKIPLQNSIKNKIKFISKKMPGLNSFFGIDFIIFKKKYYFLEINPRITTSYKNIKKNIKIKTAKKILNTL
tara:strand:+ start:5948 stop:6865 length:918 start_codon:yes stop_codon:yes gene_type:complete